MDIKRSNPKKEEPKMVKDPVCGMDIDEKKSQHKSEYKGKTYYFCSPVCKKDFEKAPETYINKSAK